MSKSEIIDSFTGRYAFLSNFYPCAIELDRTYPSVEHAFVAMKTLDKSLREEVAFIPTPGQAKRFGRKLVLRPDWNNLRLDVMLDCVQRKFQRPDLRRMILNTGNALLIEGNTWAIAIGALLMA